MWNVQDRQWVIHQSPSTTVTLKLSQFEITQPVPQPPLLTGDINGGNATSVTIDGPNLTSRGISGAIIGNQFFLSISWNNGSVGLYNGIFAIPPTNTPGVEVTGSPGGHLWGVAWDATHPQDVAAWISDITFSGGVFGP